MNLIQTILLTPSAQLPEYKTLGAAGADLRADIMYSYDAEDVERDTMLQRLGVTPNNRVVVPGFGRLAVPTGIAVAVPPGWEMQIRSRSGLAANSGLFVLNSPGTIDSDYRGEIMVILCNTTPGPITINHGDRIAQAVIAQAPQFEYRPTIELSPTERGAGKFGSTGV